jgi:mRNA interferase MazF
VKRGEIWTVAGGGHYTDKPRPAVILQDDAFDATNSITIAAITTHETGISLVRPAIAPNEKNGLRVASRIMVDKISTVPKSKLGKRLGVLDDEAIIRLNRAVLVFLGLTISPRVARQSGR